MESVGNIILYFVIAISIIVFSVLTVTTRQILRSATYLLFVLFATALLAVYAGGIVVLFVFSILLTHQPGADAPALTSHRRWLGITAAVASLALCAYAVFSFDAFAGRLLAAMPELTIDKIGHFLLSTDKLGYLLPFEAVSVLLLACIIGGVVIARRR